MQLFVYLRSEARMVQSFDFFDQHLIRRICMEEWELEFEWLRVRHLIKDAFKREALPDLNAILFLIGVQELGRWQKEFTKEEKQDLMHIAVCRLLSYDGYYEFAGRDQDGWPHWDLVKPFSVKGADEQEIILKTKVIQYFKDWEREQDEMEN